MLSHRRMRSIVLLFLSFLAVAAAVAQVDARPAEGTKATIFRIAAPERLRQGDPLLAWIIAEPMVVDSTAPAAQGSQAATAPADSGAVPSAAEPRLDARLLDSAGKTVARVPCFDASSLLEAASTDASSPRLFGALMALPTDLAPGAYTLAASRAGEVGASAIIAIEARAFPLETIPLDGSNAKIQSEPSKRKDEEARKLYAVLEKIDAAAVYADGSPFLFPVEGGFKSAGFGDRRRYVYPSGGSDTSVHEGIDWAVVKGTVVRACERGKVVLVADREVTGKTIVIEHLPGLYSLYFHLSSVEASEGKIVERGEGIALSGSTGLSTGPHLHWELWARDGVVDPEYWLGPALLDKEAIKAKITALIEGR
jgi:murein DD-endopeptidase MepM/ murein hydrolase activator NlpD